MLAISDYPQHRAEDLYLRACYLYYVKSSPDMPDAAFDLMHAYFRRYYPRSQVLAWVGSDNPNHYPEYIKEARRPNENERRKF